MKVACQGCHSVYSVKDETVPPKGVKAKCPKCGVMIDIQREQSGVFNPEHDYARTMVLFMPLPAQQEQQERDVSREIKGGALRVPDKTVKLTVVQGDEPGREYRLEKPRTVIGRSKAEILLDDPEVSRQHAAIESYGEKMVIKDLDSTNGTFVNQLGVRLSYLADKDEIQVGNTVFKVSIT